MTETMNPAEIFDMIRSGARKVGDNHALLSKLDSATGDGDHGTTMLRVVAAIEQAAGKSANVEFKTALFDLGWAVMGVDGGSTGPLLGSFYMGFSDAAPDGGGIDAAGLAAMFEGGLAKVRGQTQAQVGDKTLMDALIPAVGAISSAARAGQGIAGMLAQAAAAAKQGAESTAGLTAKFGRARNLGQRAVGHVDAGATSVALMFQGFADTTK